MVGKEAMGRASLPTPLPLAVSAHVGLALRAPAERDGEEALQGPSVEGAASPRSCGLICCWDRSLAGLVGTRWRRPGLTRPGRVGQLHRKLGWPLSALPTTPPHPKGWALALAVTGRWLGYRTEGDFAASPWTYYGTWLALGSCAWK